MELTKKFQLLWNFPTYALKLSNIEPGQHVDGRPVSHPSTDRAQHCLTSVPVSQPSTDRAQHCLTSVLPGQFCFFKVITLSQNPASNGGKFQTQIKIFALSMDYRGSDTYKLQNTDLCLFACVIACSRNWLYLTCHIRISLLLLASNGLYNGSLQGK